MVPSATPLLIMPPLLCPSPLSRRLNRHTSPFVIFLIVPIILVIQISPLTAGRDLHCRPLLLFPFVSGFVPSPTTSAWDGRGRRAASCPRIEIKFPAFDPGEGPELSDKILSPIIGTIDELEAKIDQVADPSLSYLEPSLAFRSPRVYDNLHAELSLVNPSANSDRFYILQVLVVDEGKDRDRAKDYYMLTRWGRNGTRGQSKLYGPYNDGYRAKVMFEDKFKLKTGLDWPDAATQQSSVEGKYEYLPREPLDVMDPAIEAAIQGAKKREAFHRSLLELRLRYESQARERRQLDERVAAEETELALQQLEAKRVTAAASQKVLVNGTNDEMKEWAIKAQEKQREEKLKLQQRLEEERMKKEKWLDTQDRLKMLADHEEVRMWAAQAKKRKEEKDRAKALWRGDKLASGNTEETGRRSKARAMVRQAHRGVGLQQMLSRSLGEEVVINAGPVVIVEEALGLSSPRIFQSGEQQEEEYDFRSTDRAEAQQVSRPAAPTRERVMYVHENDVPAENGASVPKRSKVSSSSTFVPSATITETATIENGTEEDHNSATSEQSAAKSAASSQSLTEANASTAWTKSHNFQIVKSIKSNKTSSLRSFLLRRSVLGASILIVLGQRFFRVWMGLNLV